MTYLLVRLLLFLFSIHHFGHSTRFLPMIVWDHVNPQLSCKCNWLTVPKILTYDRVDFVCPTLKVAVKLLDGYSRPKAEMNENLFRRRWPGTVDELRSSIKNGSLDTFCNRTLSDHLYTCRDGVEGGSFPVTFKNSPGDKPEEKYENGVYVFFNNGNDGREATLTSSETRCSMVFAVDLTSDSGLKVVHDISYGKCLNPDEKLCEEGKACHCHSTAATVCHTPTPSSKSILPSPSSPTPSSSYVPPTSSYVSPTSSYVSPTSPALIAKTPNNETMKCVNVADRNKTALCNKLDMENGGRIFSYISDCYDEKTSFQINCSQFSDSTHLCKNTETDISDNNSNNLGNRVNKCQEDWACLAKAESGPVQEKLSGPGSQSNTWKIVAIGSCILNLFGVVVVICWFIKRKTRTKGSSDSSKQSIKNGVNQGVDNKAFAKNDDVVRIPMDVATEARN